MRKRVGKSRAVPSAFRKAQSSQANATDPKEFDNLVGYRLRLAHNVQVQRFATVGGAVNIRPPQFAILKLLYCHASYKQTELTRALNKKHANMVALLDELESRELISRVPDPNDKRSRVLSLTHKGRRLTKDLLARHARLEQNLRKNFGSRQLDQLTKLLDAFRQLDPAPDLDEPD